MSNDGPTPTSTSEQTMANKTDLREFDMPSEKAYYLQRTQVLGEVQAELLAWAKRRFWIVAIVSVCVGWFGLRTIIKDLASDELKDARAASARAEAAADAASGATAKAQANIAAYMSTVDELRTTAASLTVMVNGLQEKVSGMAAAAEVLRQADASLQGGPVVDPKVVKKALSTLQGAAFPIAVLLTPPWVWMKSEPPL